MKDVDIGDQMNASKTKWVGMVFAVSALVACAGEADAANQDQRAEIEQLLGKYESALNASDLQAVLKLYTDDSVLMPQETPTVVGIKAVQQFYVGTFQAIHINLKFQIAEVQVLSNEWAFLRTTSTGVVKILANGTEAPAATQELFVVRKDAGQWKLARYSFSSTLPPAK
jgi:uncharacterized protein (TIGR02246 family)